MYRQIMVPTEQEHSVELPKELFGKTVEIIAFSLSEGETLNKLPIADPNSFYDSINLDFSGYKFNRDEANER
ncbi:MAG: hypothetical protein V4649_14130 [Bacteroidota bacterium]